MLHRVQKSVFAAIFAAAAVMALAAPANAESGAGLREDAAAALASLYKGAPVAKLLGDRAKAIVVFPNIVKAGFIVGGQYGEGILIKGGKTTGYYSSVAASYGLQAGAQAFGYAMFLMSDSVVDYLDNSDGWEIGAGPSVVVIDAGMAKDFSTTTLKDDVYAFVFDQKGLMAGVSIQGTKITRISK